MTQQPGFVSAAMDAARALVTPKAKPEPLERALAKFAACGPGQVVELDEEEEKAYNEHAAKQEAGKVSTGEPRTQLQLAVAIDAEAIAQRLSYNRGNALMALVRGDLKQALAYLNAEIRFYDEPR